MKEWYPTLTHLFYAVRYKSDLEIADKEVERHSNYYTKKLKGIYEL